VVVVGRECRSSRRGRGFRRLLLRERAVLVGRDDNSSVRRSAWLPFDLKQRIRMNARPCNWCLRMEVRCRQEMSNNARGTRHHRVGYKIPAASDPALLQLRKEISPPSILSIRGDVGVLAYLSALARPNTKHSFEPFHDSSMSG
jgi:hypothetical protein